MTQTIRVKGLVLLFWLGCAGSTIAAVQPHPLFSDHMVLQQGTKVPVWGLAAAGEPITVRFQGQEVTCIAAADGSWRVELAALKAGGPFELIIKGNNVVKLKDVLVGEVWICSGQSNMEWPLQASKDAQTALDHCADPGLRLFTVAHAVALEPRSSLKGTWAECQSKSAKGFSAVAYYFGRDLRKARNVPVGLIQSAWGGTPAEAWTSGPFLAMTPELKPMWTHHLANLENFHKNGDKMRADYETKLDEWRKENVAKQAKGEKTAARPPFRAPEDPGKSPWGPGQLYGGMIHPLLPFAFRGVIWYQGESNANRAYEYRTLMPALIRSWRSAWKRGDFPFLMVQLAPYDRDLGSETWPELREAQGLTARQLPNVGMVVITDAGEKDDIHPKDKETVGSRLALAARGVAYAEPIVWSGPVYESVAFEGGKAVVRFRQVGGGLMAKDGDLKGFTICGKDKQFVPAHARIEGETVIIENPDIPEPIAVRFGWSNFPEVNFYNREGLPASPFRTDNLDLITKPKAK